MKKVISALLLFTIPVVVSGGTDYFDQVDAFLKKHVHNDAVDYAAIKSHPEQLRDLIEIQKEFELTQLDSAARKAFWINAYNILVIHAVVQSYPIDSPMDVTGFFDTQTHIVAGDTLTLNQIENEKLRAGFDDPRIHFALVCAARSCPPIIPEAYHPQIINAQLEERTRTNLNDSNFIRVNEKEKTVYLSEIFKWYREDFITPEHGVLAYVNQYRKEKIPPKYSIDYYTYNWQLNDDK